MSMFSLLPETVKVRTPDQARAAVAILSRKPVLALDSETTGLSRSNDRAILLSLSSGRDRYVVFPEAIPYFKDLLENPELKLIMHNANFDSWMLLNVGIDLYRHCRRVHYRVYDTMVMHALYDSDAPHDLKTTARRLLRIEMVPFNVVFADQLRRKRKLEDILLDPQNERTVVNYAGLDAFATFQLFLVLRDALMAADTDNPTYPTLWDYFVQTEVPYTRVLWSMERAGIRIDRDELIRQAPGLEQEVLNIQKWFGRELRSPFINLRSPDQLAGIFFDHLGHKPLSVTENGAPQLNKVALKKWAAAGCQYSANLLRYRDLDKKFSTYTVNLLRQVAGDGRVHCTYNQTGARTGRLSSSAPNLQNQPPYVRAAYISRPGHTLMARDYEQLEMRILAHMSRDPTLINAILSGLDVHSSTAATMFGVPYESIQEARHKSDRIDEAKKAGIPTDETLSPREKELIGYRKAAKTINFGLMYGQGPNKLAQTLGISKDEAKGLIDRYFRTFPNVPRYFKTAIAKARELGYCTTILKRRRGVPGLSSRIKSEVAEAERKVKNTPIQGTASEIVKLAMIKIYEDPLITASGTEMLLQVHDEIIFEMPDAVAQDADVIGRISQHMSHPFLFDLVVPLDTDGKSGKTWIECK